MSRVNVPPNRSAKAARQKYKDKLWDIKHNDKHIQHFFLTKPCETAVLSDVMILQL